MRLAKIASLAAVLRRDPREFADRIRAIAQGRFEPWRRSSACYDPVSWDELVRGLDQIFAGRLGAALEDPALHTIEADVAKRLETLHGGPIDDRHNGDVALARMCYALVRCTRPRLIIETGVAHGVTSAHLLAALEQNAMGELHSIDLPPHQSGAERRVGAAIPEALRGRWQLHRGMSHRLLPKLVAEIGIPDVFVHDSLHTLHNMRFEFAQVRNTPVVVADDVELNGAFAALASASPDGPPRVHATVQQLEKSALFGVLVR